MAFAEPRQNRPYATMQIDVSFVRPVHVDDRAAVHAKATRVADRINSRAKPARKRPARSRHGHRDFFTAGSATERFKNPLKRFVPQLPADKAETNLLL